MRVFEPFAAYHSSRGGGLGLTICAEIADAMGAELTLCNRQAGGLDARFRFADYALETSAIVRPGDGGAPAAAAIIAPWE